MLPDKSGKTHEINNLIQKQVNGKTNNPNSPENGAEAVGVVPADRSVSPEELADAASETEMYHQDRAEQKQCTDFCGELAENAGYSIPVKDTASTDSYVDAVDETREIED